MLKSNTRHFIILLFLSISFTTSFGQNISLSGKILDIETEEPVPGATVTTSARNGVISASQGEFTISITEFPVVLTVSHISYGASTLKINELPTEDIIIYVRETRKEIPEVFISGKNLQEVTSGSGYSVFQFEFDKYYMWMLGAMMNSPKDTRLFLCNLIGDTLCSVPIQQPARLKTDIFRYVHLVIKDSIYQLASLNNEINLLYGEDIREYSRIMNGYPATLGNGLVRYIQDPTEETKQLYYLDSTLSAPIQIFSIENSVYSNIGWLPFNLKKLGEYLGIRTVNQIVQQQYQYFNELRGPVIFKARDSIYLLDFENEKLHAIGPDRKGGKSKTISFHHHPDPSFTNLFLSYSDILVDDLYNKVYIVYHSDNSWKFVPLNLDNGTTEQALDVPNFTSMSNVRIHGGSIYFIYPEKLYPYYQRVFKKRL